MRAVKTWILIAALLTLGCGGGADESRAQRHATEGDPKLPEDLEAAAGDVSMLEAPFTAEQIRNEWVEGLTVTMRRSSPGETRFERWTVVAADTEGADIEFAAVGEDGAVLGEPVIARSTWGELRNHASFRAATASREWATRDTALGTLEGWVYRVADEEPDTVTELFFAASLPGAPVQMTTLEYGEVVLELEQVARFGPAGP
jgi:hypothetical protein